MAKVTPISEHFQHFLAEMKESFWGDLYGQTKLAWQLVGLIPRIPEILEIDPSDIVHVHAAGCAHED